VRALVRDLTFNVTKRYEREDLHIAALLTYFSPLEFKFKGELIRGWMDTIIFGESSSAKSSIIEALWRHTGAGGMSRGKITYAGAVGGIDKMSNGNVVKAGLFSNNNRGLVILDEIQSMSTEDLERMTDVRSSGICQIIGIRTITALAKCRKIWIANPRKMQGVDVVDFHNGPPPVVLFKYLVPTLEDQTRFDLILGFKMSPEGLALKYEQEMVPHVFTQKVMRTGINMAWGLEPDDVVLLPETEMRCYRLGASMVREWGTDFPIVVQASQHHKLARLASACATLCRVLPSPTAFPEERKRVVVYPEHVEWVHDWMVHLFKNNDLAYGAYVRQAKEVESSFRQREAEVLGEIRKWRNFKSFLRYFTMGNTSGPSTARVDIGHVPNLDIKFNYLVQCGLLKRVRDGHYVKTQRFQELLNGEFAEDLKTYDPLPKISDEAVF
jgi:hypothetical protein